jgi:membrane protein
MTRSSDPSLDRADATRTLSADGDAPHAAIPVPLHHGHPSFLARLGKTIVIAVEHAGTDHILRLAAALAFYTALAMPPLLVLLLWCLSATGPIAESHLVNEVTYLIGTDGGLFVESIIENSQKSESRGWASAFSICALLVSATGVFSELQDSLGVIWKIPVRHGPGIVDWLRKRMLSFAMVGAVAFLMLVSLAASTAVSLLESWLGSASVWRLLSEGLSFGVFVAMFAAMYWLLSARRIAWRDVLVGSVVTAAMFALGKFLIGLYLARGSIGSAYGAAGSLLIILVWVYYSSIVVFFGAELARAWGTLRRPRAPRVQRRRRHAVVSRPAS